MNVTEFVLPRGRIPAGSFWWVGTLDVALGLAWLIASNPMGVGDKIISVPSGAWYGLIVVTIILAYLNVTWAIGRLHDHGFSASWAFFAFHGRMNRAPFWTSALVVVIVELGAYFSIIMLVRRYFMNTTVFGRISADTPLTYAQLAAGLITLYPSAAITVKRLHDLNWSGWWWLVLGLPSLILLAIDEPLRLSDPIAPATLMRTTADIINFVSFAVFVVLGSIRGTRGPNRYGADPVADVTAGVPAQIGGA